MFPVRSAILEITPTKEDATDSVVALLHGTLNRAFVIHQQRVPSERYLIEEILRRWCDEEEIDLVVTVGGTFPAPGPSGEEIVPEATAAIVERAMPSLPETMRSHAGVDDPMALLDRGMAGIRGRTLVINLPAGQLRSTRFLEAITDLLVPILSRLRPSVEPTIDATVPEVRGLITEVHDEDSQGLDPEEFAAFLRRRRAERDGM